MVSAKVHIIILNWNGWQDTTACVESCKALTWPDYQIIVVDNGSTDGSEGILREGLPDVEIIQTGANLGFAGGNNAGIRKALEQGADFVWLLNNDTIVDPDALTRLVLALQVDISAGMAGSLIYYHDERQRIWSAGGSWKPGSLNLRQRGAYQIDSGQFYSIESVGSVSGCSMIVKADTIRRIGMLAEEYFLYWEDTDWCARALAGGEKILFVPASKVWHKVSASTKGRSKQQYYYYTRNGVHFFMTYDLRSLPFFLLYLTADVLMGLLRGNCEMCRGFLSGMADCFSGRMGWRDFQ